MHFQPTYKNNFRSKTIANHLEMIIIYESKDIAHQP